MRIRTIKPEFWTDKRVASWDHFTRLLFIGLWSAADDHGRGSAESARLASELFPYDLSRDPRETLARVAAGLDTLAASCRITLYEVDGEAFYEVASWSKHQRVDNAGKPRVPTPSDGVVRPSRDPRENRRESPLEQGTGNREMEQGTGNGVPPVSPPPSGDPIPTKTIRMNKARPILHVLNQESGRAFRETEANLLLIAARLDEEGVTVESMMQMVRRQCAKWRNDPKMSEYLRPETLFGKTKFESYHANRNMPINEDAGSGRNGQSAADFRRSLVAGADDVQRQAELAAAREREMVESGRLPI